MGKSRDRANRSGSDPINISDVRLSLEGSNDIKVTAQDGTTLKKVFAEELQVGTGSDRVIVKRDSSTGKVQFQTTDGSTTTTTQVGTGVVTNPGDLPLTGNSAGDTKFVTSNNNLMIYNGTGWYKIATVTNASPTISSAGNASYSFATDGTPVIVEIAATDPEGLALQYKYQVTSGSLGSTATVTSSSTSGGTYSAINANTLTSNKYFKVTPSTNTAHAGTFSLTFSASDGVNVANSSASSFTLGFDVGGSIYFDGSGDRIEATDNASFLFGTGAFSIECFYIPDFDTNGSSTIFLYDIGSENIRVTFKNGDIRAQIDSETQLTYSVGSLDQTTWYHIAFTRDSSGKVQLFHNGVEVGSYTGSTANITATTMRIADKHSGSKEFTGYISNFRIVKGQLAYTLNPETGASTSFDGSGDYIDTTNPLSGTGDFTMEGWIYHTTSGSYDGYFSTCQASGADGGIVVAIDKFFVTHGGGSSQIGFSGGAIGSNGVWYHVALQRISNVFYLYKNGVQQGSATATVNLTGSTIRLGSRYMDNTTHLLTGYISNFRIVTGSAVYAASGFTPPTSPLTAISGTQLLTCQNSTGSITDASSNGYTITANGNAAGSAETPFATNFTVPTTDLSAVGGTNTKFLALKENAPKYETGGCGWAYNKNANLAINDSNLVVGTGDFTIEFYYRFESHGDVAYPLMFDYMENGYRFGYSAGSGTNPTSLGIVSSGSAFGGGGGTVHGTAGVGLNIDQWYHFAMVRTGGNVKVYIDGVELLSTTNGGSYNITDGKFKTNGTHAGGGQGLDGGIWMSQLRFCSKAVYTGAFTPPRNITKTGGNYESTTNVSNPTASETELFTLIRGNASGIIVDESDNSISITKNGTYNFAQYGAQSANLKDNSSASNTLIQSGNPLGSYVSPFSQANGSIECDDYDNRYIYVDDSNIELGSGDFCIEYWFYDKGLFGVGSANQEIYEYNGYWSFSSSSYVPFPSSGGTSAANGFTIYHNKGTTRADGAKFDVSNITSGSGFMQTSGSAIINPLTWYHMAIVRYNNEIKLYFNGTHMPFTSTFTNSTNITYNRLAIGGGYAQYAVLTGHISNFRLVVGSPVYTGNFTVPTSALTAITNTKLLTAQHSNQIIDASGNCTIIPVNNCVATRLNPF